MALSILLHLAILSTLSIAALGQTTTLTQECTDALTAFTQDTACFGSEEGIDGFLATFNSTTTSMFNPMDPLSDPNLAQAIMVFYDGLCASQNCVNSYGNVLEICYGDALRQVGWTRWMLE